MQIDQTTLQDLAIFNRIEEHSILHILNYTRTSIGREQLKILLSKPLDNIQQIQERQKLLKTMEAQLDHWPQNITNGTIQIIERYFKAPVSGIPYNPNKMETLFFQLLHKQEYGTVKFTATHILDFVRGLQILSDSIQEIASATSLHIYKENMDHFLQKENIRTILDIKKIEKLEPKTAINIIYFAQGHKTDFLQMIKLFGILDAFHSLVLAKQKLDFQYPNFVESDKPTVEIHNLFHPLVTNAIANDISLKENANFFFLTGANMGGKSTFIKAVGIATYLAHIGIAVPAKSMTVSYLDGILSNIQVVDNVLQGESYFYNEVQRVRQTVEKVKTGAHWLILIDELFKGTNVQDAIRCSLTVIKGLSQIQNSLFILSTHLYEIGEEIETISNIQLRYFETEIENDKLSFSYKLAPGISSDRIGYLILKKEGIVDALANLS